MNHYNKRYIDYESIVKILDGDEKELIELLKFYDSKINRHSSKVFYDTTGEPHKYLDEDKCQYIKVELIKALKKFKL